MAEVTYPIVVTPGYARVDMHLIALPVTNIGPGIYRSKCGREIGTALLAASVEDVTCRACSERTLAASEPPVFADTYSEQP